MAPNSTKITESLIQRVTKCKKIEAIKYLSLTGHSITEVDTDVLKKLKSLTTLDLSNNDISAIPNDLHLKNLQTLDISNNCLTSLDFVQNFPKLDTLYVEDNDDLEKQDLLWAVTKCKSLKNIDGDSVCALVKIANQTRDKFEIQVKTIWEVLFAAQYATGIPKDAYEQVKKDFTASLMNDKLLKAATTKFEIDMLHRLAEETVEAASDGSMFNESQGSRGTPRSARLNHLYIHSGKPDSTTTTPSRSRRSLLDTPSQRPSTPGKNVETPTGKGKKRPRETTPGSESKNRVKAIRTEDGRVNSPAFTALKNKDEMIMQNLPPVPDYDPAYFVRCHSDDNDPSNSYVKVWRCAFEPKTSNPAEHTDTVATCGGKIVCLLDCNTGKVMKRFKDTQKKECFFTLAWTTIPVAEDNDQDKTNILAVAGSACDVKLIHPSQFVMYAVLEGHRRYISCLAFHPSEPTYLFSGGNDDRIIMWDIGIPNLTDYTSDHRKLMVLKTPGTDALTLSISPKCDVLLAGCENTCYVWKIDNLDKITVNPDMNLLLPRVDDSDDEEQVVDGLTILSNDYVVTKCAGQSCLSLWNLRDCIPDKIKGTRPKGGCVIPRALLQYIKTTVDYIYLTSSEGLVAAGDDKGCIRLYNLEKTVKKNKVQSDSVLKESLTLEWPEVTLGRPSDDMKELLDPEGIVINTVSVQHGGQYIVCGTDNNMVCIWRRTDSVQL